MLFVMSLLWPCYALRYVSVMALSCSSLRRCYGLVMLFVMSLLWPRYVPLYVSFIACYAKDIRSISIKIKNCLSSIEPLEVLKKNAINRFCLSSILAEGVVLFSYILDYCNYRPAYF